MRAGSALAPETKERLAELFADRTCCRCGEPATRLAGNRFYCAMHHLRRQLQVVGRGEGVPVHGRDRRIVAP